MINLTQSLTNNHTECFDLVVTHKFLFWHCMSFLSYYSIVATCLSNCLPLNAKIPMKNNNWMWLSWNMAFDKMRSKNDDGTRQRKSIPDDSRQWNLNDSDTILSIRWNTKICLIFFAIFNWRYLHKSLQWCIVLRFVILRKFECFYILTKSFS